MSADPTPPSASDPTPPKPPAEPVAGDNAEAFRNKRRFRRGGEAEENEKPPDQAIEILSSLLQDLVAKKEQRPAAPEPVAAPSKSAKYHRLSKTGSGNPTAPVEGTSAPAEIPSPAPGSPAPTTAPSAAPSAPLPAAVPPPVAFRPAPLSDPDVDRRRARLWKTLFFLSLLALAGLGVYAARFPRTTDESAATTSKGIPIPANSWTDATLQQLDQALAADQAGDLDRARSLATAITPANAALPPGLAIYLAGLETRTERTYDAEGDLQRLSKDAAPKTLAAAQAALGFNFTRTRDFEKAADAYKVATHNDPFSAALFYHEGEVARHAGHLPDAISSFRRALDRVPTGQPEMASLRDCAGLKLRLCLVEQGQESEFQAELDEQLKSSPSGHWLLTAAAVALQHKDLSAAAEWLGRARAALGRATFDELLNDYFFRAYADRKELAEFFPESTTRRARLLPTHTHTIEP